MSLDCMFMILIKNLIFSDGRLMEPPSVLSASNKCIKMPSTVIPVHILKVKIE